MASNASRRLCAKISSHVRPGMNIQAIHAPERNLSVLVSKMSLRSLSTTGGKGGSGDDGKAPEDDPFGLNFEDGETNIGPKDSLPPNYVRDSATGKFTGEIKVEASEDDKRLLNLGPIGNEILMKQRFEQSLEKSSLDLGGGLGGDVHSLDNIARRIREEKGAMKIIGRKPSDVKKAMAEEGADADDVAASLTEDELAALYKFIDQADTSTDDTSKNTEKIVRESEDLNLIPTTAPRGATMPSSEPDEDNPDLDVSWMSMKSQRAMSDIDPEDMESPFANLMPMDFNPGLKVNRKRAKPIPKELLHQNNLALLRRYVTPGGQIMKRVQTRLGAKHQRKIAKLVKRARHMGLIPHLGQWKVEDHGNVKDASIFEDKDWEKRLLERGLVNRKSPIWEEKQQKTSDPSSGW